MRTRKSHSAVIWRGSGLSRNEASSRKCACVARIVTIPDNALGRFGDEEGRLNSTRFSDQQSGLADAGIQR
jgi:hypothetical protein